MPMVWYLEKITRTSGMSSEGFRSDFHALSAFKNIHEGKRAIVCGSGPSLNNIDFSRVLRAKNIIFACNQSVTCMNDCDYFCMTDHAVPQNAFFEYGVGISTKIATFGHFFKDDIINSKKFYKKIKDKILFLERETTNLYEFDKTNKFIYGIDVVHVASHFAYVTGCSEIVLAGVDLKYQDDQIYCDPSIYGNDVDWSGHISTEGSLEQSFKGWKSMTSNKIDFFTTSEKSRLSQLMSVFPVESLYE